MSFQVIRQIFLWVIIIVNMIFLLEEPLFATEAERENNLSSKPVYWFEGTSKKQAWVALDEVAIFYKDKIITTTDKEVAFTAIKGILSQKGLLATDKQNQEQEERFTLLHISRMRDQKAIVKQAALANEQSPKTIISPVCYVSTNKNEYTRMVFLNELIAQFKPNLNSLDIKALEEQYNLDRIKVISFAKNTFIYQTNMDLIESIEVANSLSQSDFVSYAYPNWYKKTQTKATLPNDVLFNDQWNLLNTGQSGGLAGHDVAIVDVWDTYQASPQQVIAIVDDGLDMVHEDLAPNILPGLSWDFYGNDNDPSPSSLDKHGTACAGVAAGRGGNSIGISGAAPKAGLVGFRLTVGLVSDVDRAAALTKHNGVIDIYSNSWGSPDDIRLDGFGPLALDALKNGVTNGRNNLGNIYVFAGGNGKGAPTYENSNTDGFVNTRYSITVAASTDSGTQSYYSEPGANIMVTAPSGGGNGAITTTDVTGTAGYNSAVDGHYTNGFDGTSAATPLVSGIIALILEANPSLTWRDIRYILAQSSDKIDADDSDWKTNSAGYTINHKYGFGRINAGKAVTLAESWSNVAAEISTESQASPNTPIPDNNTTGVSNTVTISEDFKVEFAEIYFSASDHPWWRDLEITLTSPHGTVSLLAARKGPMQSGYNYDNWRFGSVHHFMESSKGDWKLTVKDLGEADTGTFQSWKLVLYGTKGGNTSSDTSNILFLTLPAILNGRK